MEGFVVKSIKGIQKFQQSSIETLKDAEANLNKFKSCVKIDYGLLGRLGQLVGKIPMWSPKPSICLEYLAEAEKILYDIVLDSKMWFPKDKLCGENNIVRKSLLLAMYALPEEDPMELNVIVAAASSIALFYLEQEEFGNFLFHSMDEAKAIVDEFGEIVLKIMKCEYARFEDVPCRLTSVGAIFRFYWNLTQRYGHLVPLNMNITHLEKALRRTTEGAILLRIEQVGHKCSNLLYGRVRGSVGTTMEFLLAGIETGCAKEGKLNTEIRRHFIFKHLLALVAEVEAITTDVLGFVRKMEGYEAYYNRVIRSVELNRISFQQSFTDTINVISTMRKDIGALFAQLVVEFPGNDQLRQIIILMKRFMDANIWVSSIAPRYPQMKITEVRLELISKSSDNNNKRILEE